MTRRRRGTEPAPHSDRWVVSYADFITLLLAVFTVLYAISVVDARRAQQLVQAIESSFEQRRSEPGEPGASEANAERQRESALRERAFALQRELGEAGGFQLRESAQGLVLSLTDAFYFGAGSDGLSPSARPALARLAALLADVPNHVRVEGHSDAQSSASARYPSNWHLSSARAAEIAAALERAGVPAHRLSAVGFGSERPLASNDSAEGRALNRRVDVVLLRPSELGAAPEETAD